VKIEIAGIASLIATALFAQTETPKMKASIVREYGGPDVFKLEEGARLEPKENHLE
jgi:hypothetical protein